MRKEFARYPKYEQAYLRAFEKMLKARAGNGKPYQKWQTADDVMRWWLSEEKQQKVDDDQLSFFLLDA
jgi:phosphoadenosine phosphosulfate reductase